MQHSDKPWKIAIHTEQLNIITFSYYWILCILPPK